MSSKQFFPFSLAFLILTSFGAVSGVEVAQAKPPDHAPAWGNRCNRGEQVSDFPGNRDCREKQDEEDDRDDRWEDRRDRDGRFDDRFNRSLVVGRISNQELPRALRDNEVFRLIERGRYAGELQVLILRENGEILRSRNGRTVRIGRISRSEVREFERLLQDQDFEEFDRRSYSSRGDRGTTLIFLNSQDATVRYEQNVENWLPTQLRRVVDAFERLTRQADYADDGDRDQYYSGTVSAGTRISVEYPNSDQIILRRNERRDLTLTVARDIRESRGDIVIPEGSRIEGELRPADGGTRFVADRLVLRNGRDYDIDASSDIVTRNRSILGSITRDGRIDVGTILGEVLGGRGERDRSEVVVVYPDTDLDLTLRNDLTIR